MVVILERAENEGRMEQQQGNMEKNGLVAGQTRCGHDGSSFRKVVEV